MLAAEIRSHVPGFAVDYEIDPVRQAIADSWPDSLDDSAARAEWGWAPHFDLAGDDRGHARRSCEARLRPSRSDQ